MQLPHTSQSKMAMFVMRLSACFLQRLAVCGHAAAGVCSDNSAVESHRVNSDVARDVAGDAPTAAANNQQELMLTHSQQQRVMLLSTVATTVTATQMLLAVVSHAALTLSSEEPYLAPFVQPACSQRFCFKFTSTSFRCAGMQALQ
jgi:hypothetical protein